MIVSSLLLALVYSLPVLLEIATLQLNSKIRGSDHYFHLMLIRQIQENQNRFIKKFSNFLGNNHVFYPQLLHWILSFFYPRYIRIAIKLVNITVYLLIAILTFTFWKYIISIYGDQLLLSDFELLLLIGLILVFTPYNYFLKNAKNSGLSARALGILWVHIFLYSLIMVLLSGSYLFLIISAIAVLLTLLTSQFAFQYILFSTPLISILLNEILLIVPLLLGMVLFYILLRDIAIQFLKGQIFHKKLYSKYLAKKFILKLRYSIWRDWIYDFWKMLFDSLGKRKFDIAYIYENSLFILIFLFPAIPLIIPYSLNLGKNSIFYEFQPFYIIVISSGILFLVFSLRQTRFLGEPERYVEFVIPFLAFICVMVVPPSIIIYLIVYSVIFSLVQIFIGFYINKKKKLSFILLENKLEAVLNILIQDSNTRLLCNDMQLSKFFFPHDIKIFRFPLQFESVRGIHFNELFSENYRSISPEIIPEIIKRFEINYLFINKDFVANDQMFWRESNNYVIKWEKDSYLLLYKKS